ncbi:MAG TPA: phosphoribosylformylglycinamidine synthase subunit PurS [Methanomicrobiales archaeon]|nr:phosphoribosylformylglycinamidine synthase subunit PurS [Methanomicrobiales archaeon]HXW98873.1 phosphoribosylformylglycinamidine synthase subunit PurS [Methanomicrobiales archaeon]
MNFDVEVRITLKPGILDPEARAIQHALADLGFPTKKLSSARVFSIALEAKDRAGAEETARQMCERLLANPVIHHYEVEVRA